MRFLTAREQYECFSPWLHQSAIGERKAGHAENFAQWFAQERDPSYLPTFNDLLGYDDHAGGLSNEDLSELGRRLDVAHPPVKRLRSQQEIAADPSRGDYEYTVFQPGEWPSGPGRIAFRKGAPFADYSDFADCTSKNQDKNNPDAYCGEIKHRTEDKKSSRLTEDDETSYRDPDAQRVRDEQFAKDWARYQHMQQINQEWQDAVRGKQRDQYGDLIEGSHHWAAYRVHVKIHGSPEYDVDAGAVGHDAHGVLDGVAKEHGLRLEPEGGPSDFGAGGEFYRAYDAKSGDWMGSVSLHSDRVNLEGQGYSPGGPAWDQQRAADRKYDHDDEYELSDELDGEFEDPPPWEQGHEDFNWKTNPRMRGRPPRRANVWDQAKDFGQHEMQNFQDSLSAPFKAITHYDDYVEPTIHHWDPASADDLDDSAFHEDAVKEYNHLGDTPEERAKAKRRLELGDVGREGLDTLQHVVLGGADAVPAEGPEIPMIPGGGINGEWVTSAIADPRFLTAREQYECAQAWLKEAVPADPDAQWGADAMRYIRNEQYPGITIREAPGGAGDMPEHGYMVSLPDGNTPSSYSRLDPQHIRDYVRQHADEINSDPGNYYGGWEEDDPQGKPEWYDDVSRNVADPAQAARDAVDWNQKAVYDIDSGQSISTEDMAKRYLK